MTKPKFAFIIYGNIASGKTSVAKLLAQSLPQLKHLCADDIRVQSSLDGKILSENEVYSLMVEHISQHTQVIFESTGAGNFFKHYLRQFTATGFKVIKVYLKCSPLVCYNRYQNRIDTSAAMVPMAHPSNIKTSIEHINNKISGLTCDIVFNTELYNAAIIADRLINYYGTKC
jgi:predicted ABC-type ATPase